MTKAAKALLEYAQSQTPLVRKFDEERRRGNRADRELEANLPAYRKDPELYCREVLKRSWTADQARIARQLFRWHRVLVRASHSVGKTNLAGGLVNYFIDCFGPCIILTTAPTEAQVIETLWKEVRTQRLGRRGLLPKAPRIEFAPNWFAAGYTAKNATAFQGRHEERVLILFDESVGIDGSFWEAAEGMMTGEECYWLALTNPTDITSRCYQEDISGRFHVETLSALDHPNIAAELEGKPPIIPGAVRLDWVRKRLEQWAERIIPDDAKPTDIEFEGQWWRPGPLFESRVLGRWPTQGISSVWSDAAWQAALIAQSIPIAPLELGCDVARFGDDFTSIVARRGRAVIHHETHNGWDYSHTTGRLKQLCKELARKEGKVEDPTKVLVKVDSDGIGGEVIARKEEFNFVSVSASSPALEPEDFPNRRSELWFSVAERARAGELDITRLSQDSIQLLRSQAMSPTWRVDSKGRRVVEPKEATKKRIHRSPDDMDALNLAFAPPDPVQWGNDPDFLRKLAQR
jgi:hypothetical protein